LTFVAISKICEDSFLFQQLFMLIEHLSTLLLHDYIADEVAVSGIPSENIL